MSKGSKVSKEVESAAIVQALLAGGSIDSAVEDAAMIQSLLEGGIPETVNYEDDTDEIDIDMEELEKPKKKAKKAKKEDDKPVTKLELLESCVFATIEKSVEFSVRFGDHDIHYKEQHWPIPERDVIYWLERIDIPKEACNAAEDVNGKAFNDEIKAKAKSGEVRYLKIVSYENIPYQSRCLGYVEVKPDKKVRTHLHKDNIKKSYADCDKVMASVKKANKQMIKYL